MGERIAKRVLELELENATGFLRDWYSFTSSLAFASAHFSQNNSGTKFIS
jgi:hypothetical protein